MACMPFVEFDTVTKRFQVTPESREFLLSLKETQLAVVALAGPYRHGKSTLLNRVLLELPVGNNGSGFEVGHTVNACTKGLWLSTKLLPCAAPGSATLVIDTEGLGATTADKTHDTNIFALALLLSSLFMYNSKCAIDQTALNDLSLVTQISKHMRMSAASSSASKRKKTDAAQQDQDQKQNEEELREAFPVFMYVIRDFALKLQDPDGNPITPAKYLDNALQHIDGGDGDKNDVRRTLRTMFAKRDCFTMVQPATRPEVLRNLHKHGDADLDPLFLEQAARLREKVQQYAHPKKLDARTPVTGALLVMLAEQYCQAFNDKRTPVIKDVWKYITVEQCQAALKAAVALFEETMAREDCDTRRKLEAQTKAAFDAAVRLFQQQAVGDTTEAFDTLRATINTKVADMRKALQLRLSETAATLLNALNVDALAPSDIAQAVQQAQIEFAKLGKDPESQSAWDHECCTRLLVWLPSIVNKQALAFQEARKQASECDSQLSDLKTRTQQLQQALDAVQTERDAAQQKCAGLESQLGIYTDLANEATALRTQVAVLEPVAAQAADALQQIAVFKEQHAALLMQQVTHEEQFCDMQARLDAAQKQIKPLEALVKQLQQAQAEQLAEIQEQTRASLLQLRENKDAAVKKYTQAQHELDTQRQQLAQAQQALAQQKSLGAEKLQEQITQMTAAHKLALQTKETEKADLVNKFQQDLARIKSENSDARAKQAEEHRQALALVTGEKVQVETKAHALAIECTSLKQSLEHKTSDVQRLHKDLTERNAQLTAVTNELTTAKTRVAIRDESNARLSAQSAQLSNKINELEDELRQIRAQHAAEVLKLECGYNQRINALQDRSS